MKNIIIIVGLLLINTTAYAAPRQKNVTCSPTVEKEKQHRSEMKHRKIPTEQAKPTFVTVTDMLNWDIPKNPRGEMSDPRESQVFTVEGYVIHAKLAEDDCDVHMEIASTNDESAPRVIVEIPNDRGFEEAQKLAINSKGKKVSLTGYPFWDSAHWSKADQRKGHNHGSAQVGTLWELHPAWKVEVK